MPQKKRKERQHYAGIDPWATSSLRIIPMSYLKDETKMWKYKSPLSPTFHKKAPKV